MLSRWCLLNTSFSFFLITLHTEIINERYGCRQRRTRILHRSGTVERRSGRHNLFLPGQRCYRNAGREPCDQGLRRARGFREGQRHRPDDRRSGGPSGGGDRRYLQGEGSDGIRSLQRGGAAGGFEGLHEELPGEVQHPDGPLRRNGPYRYGFQVYRDAADPGRRQGGRPLCRQGGDHRPEPRRGEKSGLGDA